MNKGARLCGGVRVSDFRQHENSWGASDSCTDLEVS